MLENKSFVLIFVALTIILSMGESASVFASVEPVSSSFGLKVRGTLVHELKTQCVVTVEPVEFGNVNIGDVKTESKVLPLHYSVDCSGLEKTKPIELTFVATPVTMSDLSLASTSSPGLWLRFLNGTKPIMLNKTLAVSLDLLPDVFVQLAKDPVTDLVKGEFNASATLAVAYL